MDVQLWSPREKAGLRASPAHTRPWKCWGKEIRTKGRKLGCASLKDGGAGGELRKVTGNVGLSPGEGLEERCHH